MFATTLQVEHREDENQRFGRGRSVRARFSDFLNSIENGSQQLYVQQCVSVSVCSLRGKKAAASAP